MNSPVQAIAVPENDLIDRIAESLPADVRADYYREMRHCRSLPENDEMLRILRAMQFGSEQESDRGPIFMRLCDKQQIRFWWRPCAEP